MDNRYAATGLRCQERRDLAIATSGARIARTHTTTGSATFVGHAAVFNSRTAIGDPTTWGFFEEIAPGAFLRTLLESDVRMLIDHESPLIVARTKAGTLHLTEDRIGLAVTATLDDRLSYVRDLTVNLDNGNVSGMSFGFYVRKDEWSSEAMPTARGDIDVDIRRILDIDLVEVSAVTFPAYPDTDAALRAQRPEIAA